MHRRQFVHNLVASGGIFKLNPEQDQHSLSLNSPNNLMQIDKSASLPLETITIRSKSGGLITVRDGLGRIYSSGKIKDSYIFQAGGALGNHTIMLFDQGGQLKDFLVFKVEAKTCLEDSGGQFSRLFYILHKTMLSVETGFGRNTDIVAFENRFYEFFVCWLRDHVHTMKGMKYFYPELKSGIELYSNHQRSDGMIWDNFYPRNKMASVWDLRFQYGDFIRPIENEIWEFRRIPVEADVEYLFLEGLYYTWKATGDTDWMKKHLDTALKAVYYSTSNEYRWSEKYKLIKRGFTIDTWDFQPDSECVAIIGTNPDPMVIKNGKTRFGIMFGDNTGMAAGCRYLSEMLNVAGRKDEALKMQELSEQLMQRINALAWNGSYFTHHVQEDPGFGRDLGVNMESQVSLSNAYSINRGISPEQAKAIINTYQRLRAEMPERCPGEWFTIYPPFQKGFGTHNDIWDYMNGGVISIVAGELAHGAYRNGQEKYATDILLRILDLAKKHDDYLPCTFRGQMPTLPIRNFYKLDLRPIVNVDFNGKGAPGVPGWTMRQDERGYDDIRNIPVGLQNLADIPFEIIDPAGNDRKAAIGISGVNANYLKEVTIPVNRKAASLHLLHTAIGSGLAGILTMHFADGTTQTDYIGEGKIGHWWVPKDPPAHNNHPVCKVAWRGKSDICPNVGVYVYGLNNQYPEKEIKSLRLEGLKTGIIWMVLGITFSDHPVFFMPSEISYGIPDNWGAAACFYALMEGLAGIRDEGLAFDKARISPRWTSADEKEINTTLKYEASGGYVSYHYLYDAPKNKLSLQFTGTPSRYELEILLPDGFQAGKVMLNQKKIPFNKNKKEISNYVTLTCNEPGCHQLEIELVPG